MGLKVDGLSLRADRYFKIKMPGCRDVNPPEEGKPNAAVNRLVCG